MSFICIDNTEKQGIGFVPSTVAIDRTEIKDAIHGKGDELNKMSTSIPTPFARLFMYANAFNEVNTIQLRDLSHGHDGESSYHALVNEWMDLLEFLYVYGISNDMEIYRWGKDEIKGLKIPGNEKYYRLAIALEESLEHTPNLDLNSDIFLFRYNNQIVGGTSPVSLIFLSPNWRTSMKEHHMTFPRSGNDNGNLFDDKIVTLSNRDIDFRKFVYMYVERILSSGVTITNEINYIITYIRDERVAYDAEENQRYNNCFGKIGDKAYDADFNEKNYLKILDIQRNSVLVSGIQLWSLNPKNIKFESDYAIKPSCDRWKTEVVRGENVILDRVPLVLNQQGLDNAWYDKKRRLKWNKDWMIPTPIDTILSNRELPGLPNALYPYITIDDLLEPKIICTSFKVQKSRFFTGSSQDLECLLPLKKEYFRFFDVSDLAKYDVQSNCFVLTDMLTIEETDRDNKVPKFIVTLRIPVQNGRHVVFTKTYADSDVVVCTERGRLFDFAVFPFYRYTSGNVYNVMLGYDGNPISLCFHDVMNLTTPLDVKAEERSESPLKTIHMHLDKSFDLVELSVEGTKGLIVPLMRNLAGKTKDLVFCVDFGTSNTHVVYGEQGVVTGIKPLDIYDTMEDLQVVYLNDHQEGNPYVGFGNVSSFLNIVRREFAPAVINDPCGLSFPMTTNICEKKDIGAGNASLFGQMNIGFNYQKEIGDTSNQCNYVTNIKWQMGSHNPRGNERVKIYFEELMWIIKNKSVLSGGGLNFQFVFTYPQSMNNFSVSKLQDLWAKARVKVGAATDEKQAKSLNKKRLEGVAPYYCPNINFGNNKKYVNIDIGGGTCDIIYIDPSRGGDKLSYSAIFAANDIWGDGVVSRRGMNNGFITAYERSEFYTSKDDGNKIKTNYADIKKINRTTSADLVNFLFAHNDYFNFTEAFDNDSCSDLKPVLLVHLTSIVYYLGLALKRDGLEELPAIVSFTGMGSKYIDLIGNDKTITEIVRAVFQYAVGDTLKNANAVSVIFQENPKEVTAEGGVLMFDDQTISINPVQSLPYGWKNEEYSEEHITPEAIDVYQKPLLEEFERFLNMFSDAHFIQVIKSNCDFNPCGITRGLNQLAKDSFEHMKNTVQNNAQTGDLVDEPMFFWPLKDSLYRYGQTLVNPNNPNI